MFDHKSDESYIGFLDQEVITYIKQSCMHFSKNDYITGGTSTLFPVHTIQNRLWKVFEELFNEGLERKNVKNRVVIHTLRYTFA